MAKTKDFATDNETAGTAATEPARGSVHVLLGRGRTGKTTWGRWAIERARSAGREVAVADGDRNNSTLSSFYPTEVSRPVSADDVSMTAWLEGLMESAIETRQPLLLDMGGGDRAFAATAHRHGFNDVLPENGVDLTAWYFVSGGRDDAETFVLMERMGFRPARRVLVLNEGLAPAVAAGQDPFAATVGDDEVRRGLDTGARLLRMPGVPLATMIEADDLFIGIQSAAAGGVPKGEDGLPHPSAKPLNLWRRNELKRWLAAMEERHAEAGVLEWLP